MRHQSKIKSKLIKCQILFSLWELQNNKKTTKNEPQKSFIDYKNDNDVLRIMLKAHDMVLIFNLTIMLMYVMYYVHPFNKRHMSYIYCL